MTLFSYLKGDYGAGVKKSPALSQRLTQENFPDLYSLEKRAVACTELKGFIRRYNNRGFFRDLPDSGRASSVFSAGRSVDSMERSISLSAESFPPVSFKNHYQNLPPGRNGLCRMTWPVPITSLMKRSLITAGFGDTGRVKIPRGKTKKLSVLKNQMNYSISI